MKDALSIPGKIANALIDIAFPPRCAVCRSAADGDDRLCASCWVSIDFLGEPICPRCATPIEDSPNPADFAGCATCQMHPPRQNSAAAVAIYDGVARDVALAMKHRGGPQLPRMIARMLAPRLLDQIGQGGVEDCVIIPVPLHRWRIWRRGFNQAALIAREIGRLTGANLEVDALQRIKSTPRLGGLTRAQRLETLRDAIAIHPKRQHKLAGKRAFLVDDVMTTGATIGECAQHLKEAGAVEVHVLCWARVLQDGLHP